MPYKTRSGAVADAKSKVVSAQASVASTQAGPTRLRPILMTSRAAILGMISIALGKGSETNALMATVVIGGLLTSMFPTLSLVPTVYTLFDDLGRRFRRDDRNFPRRCWSSRPPAPNSKPSPRPSPADTQ